MNNYIKSSLIVLLINLFLNISACANKQNWVDCPIEDRARIVKITNGSGKNKEVITVKLISTQQEFTYPEYTRSANIARPKVGDHFCTAEDYD